MLQELRPRVSQVHAPLSSQDLSVQKPHPAHLVFPVHHLQPAHQKCPCDQESKMQQKWESECSIIGNSNTSKMGTIMQR